MLRPTRERRSGQILVLFVIALVAMFSMLGLLLDGGHALAIRRQYQDAGDAAAISAANGLVQSGASAGCSATAGPPPGSARATVVARPPSGFTSWPASATWPTPGTPAAPRVPGWKAASARLADACALLDFDDMRAEAEHAAR